MPTVKLITYGCQANELDSERIAGLLAEEGYELIDREEEADLILLNTCAIREKAEQKVYSRLGTLRALKRRRAGLRIGVCGCVAQQEGRALLDRFPYLDFVLGPGQLDAIPAILRAGTGRHLATARSKGFSYPAAAPIRRQSRVRAWVSIMEGCDRFCTFCVVPFTRGRERSRPLHEILDEVQRLRQAGYREITLLGQTVNAYGKRLEPAISFVDLLVEIDRAVEGAMRVRFTSPHPADVTAELADAIGTLPSVCEHIHLPVQAGSDRTLSRMRRGYTRDEYLTTVSLLRARVEDLSITTDIIVGFPGETEEEFHDTLSLMEQVGYDGAFVFKYSQRPHTPAAAMADQVPEEVKARRMELALALLNRLALERNRACVGRHLEVLVDRADAREGPFPMAGRTRQNKIVHFSGEEASDGALAMVRITGASPLYLRGELLAPVARGVQEKGFDKVPTASYDNADLGKQRR